MINPSYTTFSIVSNANLTIYTLIFFVYTLGMDIQLPLEGKEFKRLLDKHNVSINSLHTETRVAYSNIYQFLLENKDIKRSTYKKLVEAYNQLKNG